MSEPRSPEPASEQPDPPRRRRRTRRWFQFGLGSLLVLVTLCGVLLAAWRAYLAPYRAQRETMALIERLKGSYQTQEAETWASRLHLIPAHNITLVNLADCQEPTEYFEAISRLPCLETLAVGGPAFGDQHLARLQKLSTLRWLVLDSTSVTDDRLGSLRRANPNIQFHCAQCLSIAAFRARGATIETQSWLAPPRVPLGAEPASFEYATLLDLRAAEITDAELAYLTALRNLEWLNLANVKVTDRGLANLVTLKKLKWLNLSQTEVTDTGLSHLAALKDLEELRLRDTSISDVGMAHLAALKNLKYLHLYKTRITDAGLQYVSGLKNLQELSLSNTDVTDAGLPHVATLSKLKSLSLADTKVTDAGLAHLMGLKSLIGLDLQNTLVTDAGVAKLRQALYQR